LARFRRGKWDQNAWKTEAFYGNPLDRLHVREMSELAAPKG
jgi:hypothetical protein